MRVGVAAVESTAIFVGSCLSDGKTRDARH